MLSVSSHVV